MRSTDAFHRWTHKQNTSCLFPPRFQIVLKGYCIRLIRGYDAASVALLAGDDMENPSALYGSENQAARKRPIIRVLLDDFPGIDTFPNLGDRYVSLSNSRQRVLTDNQAVIFVILPDFLNVNHTQSPDFSTLFSIIVYVMQFYKKNRKELSPCPMKQHDPIGTE